MMMNLFKSKLIKSKLTSSLLIIGLFSSINISIANELTRSTATRVHRAFEYQQSEQINKAIETLESIDSPKEYDTAYVSRMLGVLYWQTDRQEQSEQALLKAVESKALSTEQAIETERMLADIQLSLGKAESALSHYQNVLTHDQQSSILTQESLTSIHLRITQANYQLQDWSQVLGSLKQYHALEPKVDVMTLNMKLGAQLELKKWQSAIATTKQIQAFEPDKEVWWRQLTSLYLREKQYADALANLKQMQRKGFELDESNYVAMAQLYAQQGAPELAARVYDEHINSNKTSAEKLVYEAQYWQQAKEWDKSLSTWKLAVELDGSNRWSYIQLLLQQKQFETALSELSKVKQSQRSELAKTQAYYSLGDKEKARIAANRAHKLKADGNTLAWVKYLK